MAMTEASREVGVVLRRRSIDNPWIDHLWSPAMILDEVPATAPWTVLSTEAEATIYYAGSASIELFSSDTANYRDNLADGEPRIWVALRRQDGGSELELTKVTADPTEGEAMFESGCDVIGTVPMPPEIASWIAAFVDRFHVERVFHKRKRDRAGGDRQRMPGGPLGRRNRPHMSGPHKPDQDKPEEDKGFLARWSQRKQEAKQPEPKQDAPAATSDVSSEPIAEVEAEPEFDLSTPAKARGADGNNRYHGISAQRRSRTSAQCGLAKILGAGSRHPQLRQSSARLRL